jgi:hypothetical protein
MGKHKARGSIRHEVAVVYWRMQGMRGDALRLTLNCMPYHDTDDIARKARVLAAKQYGVPAHLIEVTIHSRTQAAQSNENAD